MNIKKQLKYVKITDVLSIFLMIFALPFVLVFKIFNWDYWLVSENSDEARDNGYWFYKFVRENHPEQKIAYVIHKKSKDYQKVKALGKTIPYGGFIHWIYYLGSSKKISSQKGSKPNAAVCYFLENIGLMRNKRYFLQHGVIINNLTWLYYENCKFYRFVTSSTDECEYIKENFGYADGVVERIGMCRFDNLTDKQPDPEIILLMPTWRNWISRPYKGSEQLDDHHAFKSTEYFIKWNEFLTSKRLTEILEKHNKKMIFYPHQGMQKFLNNFAVEDKNIAIASKNDYDVQDLLIRSSLLITDYSSVFMDFAYMGKQVLFYQFDEEKFRKAQYEGGYFDYHTNPIGEWCDDLDTLFDNIEKSVINDFCISTVAKDEINRIFPERDKLNCERNYNMVAARKKS